MNISNLSFEQYSAWAISRYPGYREGDIEASTTAQTLPPDSEESCPVTVKSNQNGYVVVTPVPKRSV